MTAQPRRCSSAARSSAGIVRSICSAALQARRRFGARPRRRGAGLGGLGGLLQLGDQRVGLVARELAAALALGEPHRAAGVAEPVVPGRLQQLEELLDLPVGRRWTGLLSERHAPSLPATHACSGMVPDERAASTVLMRDPMPGP